MRQIVIIHLILIALVVLFLVCFMYGGFVSRWFGDYEECLISNKIIYIKINNSLYTPFCKNFRALNCDSP